MLLRYSFLFYGASQFLLAGKRILLLCNHKQTTDIAQEKLANCLTIYAKVPVELNLIGSEGSQSLIATLKHLGHGSPYSLYLIQVDRTMQCPDGLIRHILWEKGLTLCCAYVQCDTGFYVEFCRKSGEMDKCQKCPPCTELPAKTDSIFNRKCSGISGCYKDTGEMKAQVNNTNRTTDSTYLRFSTKTADDDFVSITREAYTVTSTHPDLPIQYVGRWAAIGVCIGMLLLIAFSVFIWKNLVGGKTCQSVSTTANVQPNHKPESITVSIHSTDSDTSYINPYCSINPSVPYDNNYTELTETLYLEIIG